MNIAVPAKRKKKLSRDGLAAVVFLAPNIIGFLLLTIGPILASFALSFTKWDLIGDPVFYGVRNFQRLWSDKRFWQTMWNTLYYTVGSVPVGIVLALFFAVLLNKKIRGVLAFRTIFFLPVVSSTVAVSLLWRWLYVDDFGLIAYLFSLFGLKSPPFLSSTQWAMPAVIIMSVWKGLGYNIVLMLAGLQGVDRTYYEAAEIDGATGRQQFWNITLPLLSPTLFFITIMSLINSFQVFDQTHMLTAGGPAFASTTIVYYIYLQGFKTMKMGEACAIALVLFLIVLLITMIQWVAQKRWVHYS